MISLRRELPFGVALAVLAVGCALLGRAYGGYFISVWGVAGIALAWFAAMVMALRPSPLSRISRPGLVALTMLALLVVWTFASIAWSANQQVAWNEANRTTIYLLTMLLGASLALSIRVVRLALTAFVLAVGLVALHLVVVMGSQVGSMFLDGRLIGDVGYHNGQAAFVLVPWFIGLALAASPACHLAVRAALAGGLALLLQVGALTQSRGAALAFACALMFYLLLGPLRLRSLLLAGLAVAPVVAGWATLNDIYTNASSHHSVVQAVSHATSYILASSLLVGVAAVAIGLVDQRIQFPGKVRQATGGAVIAVVVIVLAMGGVAVFRHSENPIVRARQAWSSLAAPSPAASHASRFVTLGSTSNAARVVLWKVAVRDARDHPLTGVGAGNFAGTFYHYRTQVYDRYVRQVHNLTLEMMAERGLVGAVLWLGFIAAIIAAAARARRNPAFALTANADARALQTGVLASAVAWLVHGQFDWLWQLPAVTLPVFLAVGMLLPTWWLARSATATATAPAPAMTPALRMPGRAGRVLPVGTAVLVAVSCAIPWYASHLLDQGAALAGSEPRVAARAASLATQLTPRDPHAVRELALREESLGATARANQLVQRQVMLDRQSYISYLFAAQYYARNRDPGRAAAAVANARMLNPRDTQLSAEATAPS